MLYVDRTSTIGDFRSAIEPIRLRQSVLYPCLPFPRTGKYYFWNRRRPVSHKRSDKYAPSRQHFHLPNFVWHQCPKTTADVPIFHCLHRSWQQPTTQSAWFRPHRLATDIKRLWLGLTYMYVLSPYFWTKCLLRSRYTIFSIIVACETRPTKTAYLPKPTCVGASLD